VARFRATYRSWRRSDTPMPHHEHKQERGPVRWRYVRAERADAGKAGYTGDIKVKFLLGRYENLKGNRFLRPGKYPITNPS